MLGLFGKRGSEPEKLFFSTDMHCHVVPGVDDGSPSVERSVDLVKSLKNWGINRILATPHVTQDTFENTPEILADAFGRLKQGLDDAGVEIDIDYSSEYRIDEFFMGLMKDGKIRSFPNGYLLVENSFIQEPWNLDQTLFGIKLKGFKPILAHPERYSYYYEKDKQGRYAEIHSTGTLFQINILSLAGYYGKEAKKFAEMLMEKGMVDLVGSDLHHPRHVEAIERYLASKDYRRHRQALVNVVKNDEIFR